MLQIKTRTDDETKKAFTELARKRGVTESELLRELIASAIARSPEVQGADPEPANPTTDSIEQARLNLRMPLFLLDGAKSRAKYKSISTNRWMVDVLKTHLAQKPVPTDYQIAMLKGSNRELAGFGRNLNRIARALNESFHETDQVNLKQLEYLAAEINGNRLAVEALIKASLHAWSFEG